MEQQAPYPPPAAAPAQATVTQPYAQATPHVQQMAPQGHAQAPPKGGPAVIHTTSSSKPSHSKAPALVLVCGIVTGFCCPCALGYYVYEELKYKEKKKEWEKQQEAQKLQDRAFLMQTALNK